MFTFMNCSAYSLTGRTVLFKEYHAALVPTPRGGSNLKDISVCSQSHDNRANDIKEWNAYKTAPCQPQLTISPQCPRRPFLAHASPDQPLILVGTLRAHRSAELCSSSFSMCYLAFTTCRALSKAGGLASPVTQSRRLSRDELEHPSG